MEDHKHDLHRRRKLLMFVLLPMTAFFRRELLSWYQLYLYRIFVQLMAGGIVLNDVTSTEITNLIFAGSYFSNYRYYKQEMLENDYKNLENVITGLSSSQYDNLRQMIDIEMIINAIQYSNELGAIAICTKNRNLANLGHVLAKLADESIHDFYKNVKNISIKDMRKYMGYHEIEISEAEVVRYNRSCERYREELIILAELHEHFYDLYLTYKHGLRILPAGCKEGIFRIIIYNSNGSYTYYYQPATLMLESIKITEFIKVVFDKLYIPLIRRKFFEIFGLEFNPNGFTKTIKASDIKSGEYPCTSIEFSIPWWTNDGTEPKPFY